MIMPQTTTMWHNREATQSPVLTEGDNQPQERYGIRTLIWTGYVETHQ